jgi:hypothetical protein
LVSVAVAENSSALEARLPEVDQTY